MPTSWLSYRGCRAYGVFVECGCLRVTALSCVSCIGCCSNEEVNAQLETHAKSVQSLHDAGREKHNAAVHDVRDKMAALEEAVGGVSVLWYLSVHCTARFVTVLRRWTVGRPDTRLHRALGRHFSQADHQLSSGDAGRGGRHGQRVQGVSQRCAGTCPPPASHRVSYTNRAGPVAPVGRIWRVPHVRRR